MQQRNKKDAAYFEMFDIVLPQVGKPSFDSSSGNLYQNVSQRFDTGVLNLTERFCIYPLFHINTSIAVLQILRRDETFSRIIGNVLSGIWKALVWSIYELRNCYFAKCQMCALNSSQKSSSCEYHKLEREKQGYKGQLLFVCSS